MDANGTPIRKPMQADASRIDSQARPSPAAGGTVEPVQRGKAGKEQIAAESGPPSLRYELYDPFAEVTYRTTSFASIVGTAERLGSNRIVRIDDQGSRSTLHEFNGQWMSEAARDRQLAKEKDFPIPTTSTPVREPHVPSRASHSDVAQQTTRTPAAQQRGHTDLPAQDARADRAALVERLETSLAERYVIKRAAITVADVAVGGTEYRFRGNSTRVAFTESTFRLATDSNNPSVARSMVDVAQVRDWKVLRLTGSEEFKRSVWLEASTRGVKALGYEPTQIDLELLKREREARLTNRIEPERQAPTKATSASSPKSKGSDRGAGGRKAVMAAIEAVLVAKQVPERQREAVLEAASEKLAQRIRAGVMPKVKIYDPAAPVHRAPAVPVPERQRTRERAAPAR